MTPISGQSTLVWVRLSERCDGHMNKDRLILFGLVVLLFLLAGFSALYVVPWANRRLSVWGSDKLTDILGTQTSFRKIGLTRSGKVVVEDLKIIDPLGKEEVFFYSPRVEVTIDPLNVVKEGISLSRVYVERPLVSIYDPEGEEWNIFHFGKKDDDEKKEEKEEKKKGKPFRLRIHEVVLEGCVTRLRGMLGEEIVTVLDHKGSIDVTSAEQIIMLEETNFSTTYLSLTDMTASGVVTIRGMILAFDDFRVSRDSTDIDVDGEIDFTGDDTVDFHISRSTFDLDHVPPRYGLRHKVIGNLDLELTLNGDINSPDIEGHMYRADGEFFDYRYGNARFDFGIGGGVIDVTELSADFLAGSIGGNVSFFLRESPTAFRADLEVEGIDVTELPVDIPDDYVTDLNGQVVSYGSGFKKEDHFSTSLLDLEDSVFRDGQFDLFQAQVLAKEDGFHLVSSNAEIGGGSMTMTGDLLFAAPDIDVTTESVAIPSLMVPLRIDYPIDGELYCSVRVSDDYSRPSILGQVVVREGEAYEYSFAGLEGEVDVRQQSGAVEGYLDMKAFILEKGFATGEQAEVHAELTREGIEFDSLEIRIDEYTTIDGEVDLLYAGERVELLADNLRLTHRGVEGSVRQLLAEYDLTNDQVDIEELRMDVAGGEVLLNGSYLWPETVALEMNTDSINLKALEPLMPRGIEIEGDLEMRLVVDETFENPGVTLNARIRSPAFEGVRSDSIAVKASYADSILRCERAAAMGGGQDYDIAGSIPLLFGLEPFRFEGIYERPIDLKAYLERVDCASLELLTDEVDFIGGSFDGEITVSGTLGNPVWEGGGALRSGEGIFNLSNTYFDSLEVDYSFSGNTFLAPRIKAWLMEGGSLAASGQVTMKGFIPDSLEFDIAARDYLINQIQYISSLDIDTDLKMEGQVANPDLTGDVVVHKGILDFPTEEAVESEDDTIPFNVRVNVTAENDLWVRNDQLNLEIFLDTELFTREGILLPTGDLEVIRGTYTYFGAVFDIEEGEVHFFGRDPINPEMDVTAVRTIRGHVVENGNSLRVNNEFHLTVFGTFEELEFDIAVYDNEGELLPVEKQKALTLLLANMTNEEFEQQATPSQQKFVGQIEGILNQQTSSLIQPISRLDILELRTNLLSGEGESTRAQVTVGEYLMKDFFVSYSQDILDPSVNNIVVEIYLGKKSSLIGETDSNGRQYSVELRYRMSY